MKNVADVNSEDILTELNNLDYADDDLKLLDDEDIKPINNKQDDDLADFYMDYDEPVGKVEAEPVKKVETYTEKVDTYTEKEERPFDKYIESPTVKEPVSKPTVDTYLNRPAPVKEEPKRIIPPTPNPLINKARENYNNSHKAYEKNEAANINDLSQLFNKVSNNVKGASEIVNRNAEIKRKIDERFEELRKLQEQHEANKRSDYAEINSYKEEVYSKLQQKKADIEKDLVDLRNNQEKLDKEKKNFEDYKNSSLANLKALEKELKDSYDSRNKNIEQVELGLVKRKEQLDNERAEIAKEKEKIAKEREELANNLLQFNKLVDDFTKGIDNFN